MRGSRRIDIGKEGFGELEGGERGGCDKIHMQT